MSGSRSLLVVDDVPEILTFFARVAKTYRTHVLDVVTLSDPTAALLTVKQRDFDLIVSDYRMPRVDGIRILTAARSRNPDGRRVLMTGYNEVPATPQEIAAAGLSTRLNKPISASSVVEFLQASFSADPRSLDAWQTSDDDQRDKLRAASGTA